MGIVAMFDEIDIPCRDNIMKWVYKDSVMTWVYKDSVMTWLYKV